jgi:hypothetical protein
MCLHSVDSRQKWYVDVYLCRVTSTYTGVCQQCPDKGTTRHEAQFNHAAGQMPFPVALVYLKPVTNPHAVKRIGLPWTGNENNILYGAQEAGKL